jgi:2-keto-3-deoxy-L-rhamnonate aldolase RhmA
MIEVVEQILDNYQNGATSGIASFDYLTLDEEHVLIGIETMAMVGEIIFRHAPKAPNVMTMGQVRQEVIKSLERSLNENADVWEELSKY